MPEGLLTIQELEAALEDEFGPLEPDLTGLRLVRPGIGQTSVLGLQRRLDVELPTSFASTLTEFNLGSLTIGPTVFGHETDYADVLLGANIEPVVPWWGTGDRPTSMVMFGNSDPFALIIDCKTGAVLALQHGQGLDRALIVATDFDLFLRGLGTVFVQRQREAGSHELGAMIGALAGSSAEGLAYWRELAA